jgi:hypothetical protein
MLERRPSSSVGRRIQLGIRITAPNRTRPTMGSHLVASVAERDLADVASIERITWAARLPGREGSEQPPAHDASMTSEVRPGASAGY